MCVYQIYLKTDCPDEGKTLVEFLRQYGEQAAEEQYARYRKRNIDHSFDEQWETAVQNLLKVDAGG